MKHRASQVLRTSFGSLVGSGPSASSSKSSAAQQACEAGCPRDSLRRNFQETWNQEPSHCAGNLNTYLLEYIRAAPGDPHHLVPAIVFFVVLQGGAEPPEQVIIVSAGREGEQRSRWSRWTRRPCFFFFTWLSLLLLIRVLFRWS